VPAVLGVDDRTEGGRIVTRPVRWDERESEDGAEYGSLAQGTARMVLRLNLLRHGFQATDRFLDDWIRLGARGLIGTTVDFRKRFCSSNHYQVAVPVKGRTRVVTVVELWGRPVVYTGGTTKSPTLIRILPRGWHLSKVGRSVGSPPTCRIRP